MHHHFLMVLCDFNAIEMVSSAASVRSSYNVNSMHIETFPISFTVHFLEHYIHIVTIFIDFESMD